jgi:hypothetical protein
MKRHQARARKPLTALALSILAVAMSHQVASAQAPKSPSARDDTRAKVFEDMRQTANSFKAVSVEGDTRIPVPLVREPLHRWNDPTGDISDGSLWAWRSSGRPIALMTIEWHSIQPETWSFEFISLSTGLVEASDRRLRWTPRQAGLKFREIPDAPPPASGEAERLRQMKELLKRFSAHEYWNVTRQDYALRLLPRPIDRYADEESGLIDGAIYVFAKGTNPEALVLIEARRKKGGAMSWWYAAATLTTAAPTLRLDRKDVWTSPNKYGYLSNETYFFLETARNMSSTSPSAKLAQ